MRLSSAILVALAITMAVPAVAEEALPPELADISIVEKPGSQLPKEAVLTNQDGQKVTLGSYLEGGKPLVLLMAYYRCPMLCPLVINGVTTGLKELAWTAGDQYRVLVVSIDPRDDAKLAHDKRDAYVQQYGRAVAGNGFDFAVSDAATIKRIADAVGFRFRWDEQTQQFAHAAGAFVVTPQGTLSRTLYGISYPGETVKLALLEASEGKLGSAWDKVVLFCFHYDPNARGYVLAARRLMMSCGAVSVLLLGLFLLRLRRHDSGAGPSAKTPNPSHGAA